MSQDISSTSSSPGIDHSHSSQPSRVSSISGNSSPVEICRICHCEGGPDLPLICPCHCSGSMRYVHQSCMQQWIKHSNTRCCKICKFNFIIDIKIKPFREWEIPDVALLDLYYLSSSIRFLFFSASFLILAMNMEIPAKHADMWWDRIFFYVLGITFLVRLFFILFKLFKEMFLKWRYSSSNIHVQNAPKNISIKHQQPLTTTHFTEKVETSAESKQLSLHEDEISSFKSVSNCSTDTGRSNIANIDDTKYTSDKTPNAENPLNFPMTFLEYCEQSQAECNQ